MAKKRKAVVMGMGWGGVRRFSQKETKAAKILDGLVSFVSFCGKKWWLGFGRNGRNGRVGRNGRRAGVPAFEGFVGGVRFDAGAAGGDAAADSPVGFANGRRGGDVEERIGIAAEGAG